MGGSTHTSPSPIAYSSPDKDIIDPVTNIGSQHNLHDHYNATVSDEFGRQHVPSAVSNLQQQSSSVHHNKSMAAARSALIEMQSQGLTYQNIQELVQNIQDLLNCLRVWPCLCLP